MLKQWLALLFAVCCAGAGANSVPSLGPARAQLEPPPIISGRASFYSSAFSGRKTASGERYDHGAITAASSRFPIGSYVAVRRLLSAQCVVVKINDRMGHRGRVIDLSREAAVRLGMIEVGVTDVEIVPLPKYLIGHDHACRLAFMPPVHLHADGW